MQKKTISSKGDEMIYVEQVQLNAPSKRSAVKLSWPKVFLSISFAATVTGALFATKTLAALDKNIAAAKEEARAANIKIIKITTPSCSDCFHIDDALTTLKKQNVSVGEERAVTTESADGKALIKQFGIRRLPTYILTGEVTKKTIESFIKNNGEVRHNTFVFTKVAPIFLDSATKKEMGKITATILTDPSCTQCVNPKLTIEAYKKAGVKITDENEVVWNSAEGQSIINQYKITKVPTFLFSKDIDLYEDVKDNWSRIGTVEDNKTYVARNLFLPYRDIDKGQIIGLVDLIYLTDSTCTDCYDAQKTHQPILTQSFGIRLSSERTVDVNSAEGQGIVNQYKITKVPTVLLSASADQYINLKNVWKSVGTVETDGRYIFREMSRIGSVTYKDLASNQVIRPASAPALTGKAAQ